MMVMFSFLGASLGGRSIISAVVLACIIAGGLYDRKRMHRRISELEEEIADNYLEDI